VKTGLIGAGRMGVDIVTQITRMKGIEVVAIADIEIERVKAAYKPACTKGPTAQTNSPLQDDRLVSESTHVYASDYQVITDINGINVMLDVTGVPQIDARAAIRSAKNGRHPRMMNVETDIIAGPLLHQYARHEMSFIHRRWEINRLPAGSFTILPTLWALRLSQ